MDDDLAYSLDDEHIEHEDRTRVLVWIFMSLLVGSLIGWAIA